MIAPDLGDRPEGGRECWRSNHLTADLSSCATNVPDLMGDSSLGLGDRLVARWRRQSIDPYLVLEVVGAAIYDHGLLTSSLVSPVVSGPNSVALPMTNSVVRGHRSSRRRCLVGVANGGLAGG